MKSNRFGVLMWHLIMSCLFVILVACSTQPSVPELPANVAAKQKARPLPFDQPQEAAEYYVQKRAPKHVAAIPYAWYEVAAAKASSMSRIDSSTGAVFPSAQVDPAATPLPPWQNLGPGNIGGRTRGLVIDPGTPATMYAAGVAGGVWKTTNGGANWVPLDDLMANLAVSSLAMDPGNSSVLYAGTGEGFFNGDAVRGAGIFKTTDAGINWARLAATDNVDFQRVNDIVVSPNDSNRVYAATRNGVFQSNDGGATWSLAFTPPPSLVPGFSIVAGGCLDLEIRNDVLTDYIFVTCGTFEPSYVFRNTDAAGVGTWDTVLDLSVPVHGGNAGRIDLAIAPSDQDTVYALAASVQNSPYLDGLYAVLRSIDGGTTWEVRVDNSSATFLNTVLLSNPIIATLGTCFGGGSQLFNQGWYDNIIAVDPVNPNRVWSGGIDLFRSDDGGQNWGVASYWFLPPGDPDYSHADHHNIVFHPDYDGDPISGNATMFNSNDGGVFRTLDATAPVATGPIATCPGPGTIANEIAWEGLNNGYGVTQFYNGVAYPDASTYFGGTQDNGTVRGNDTDGPDQWQEILGGDGGYVAVDPTNTDVLYAENTGISIRKSVDGGASFANATTGISDNGLFINPFIMDPTNPNRLWTTGRFIWRTDNAAGAWQRASTQLSGRGSAIAVSPSNPNRVLVATTSGSVYSNDSAASSGANTIWFQSQPRQGFASWVAFDPNDTDVAYATYSTFGGSHVWKSSNGGQTWQAIDGQGMGALPDIPVHSIVVDPDDGDNLWIGTDLGVFTTVDGGQNWLVENTGFANTVTETLQFLNALDPSLFAFTHGRGTYKLPFVSRDFIVGANPGSADVCAADDGVYSVSASAQTGFSDPIGLSVTGLNPALSASFNVNSIVAPASADLTIGNTNAVPNGTYEFTVEGTDGASTHRSSASLRVFANVPAVPNKVGPAPSALPDVLRPTFSWSPVADADNYTLEIDDDPFFASVDFQFATNMTSIKLPTALDPGTDYHWRVTATNVCGDSNQSAASAFTTFGGFCSAPAAIIPDADPTGLTDTIVLAGSQTLGDLDLFLDISHTFVGDLDIELTHVETTTNAKLHNLSNCSGDNIEVRLDDAAATNIDLVCNPGAVSQSGVLAAATPLSVFVGEDQVGSWTLSLIDGFGGDEGVLNTWCLLPKEVGIFSDSFEAIPVP